MTHAANWTVFAPKPGNVVEVRPGDVMIVRVPDDYPLNDPDGIRDKMELCFPGSKVLVLPQSWRLEFLRFTEA